MLVRQLKRRKSDKEHDPSHMRLLSCEGSYSLGGGRTPLLTDSITYPALYVPNWFATFPCKVRVNAFGFEKEI